MRYYFIPNRRFWTVLLLVLFVLLVVVIPTMAQDNAIQPAGTEQPITPEQAGQLLLGALTAIVAGGFGGAPLTAFIVGLLKHVSALDVISAPTLNLTVGTILTVLYWLASHFGLQVQFKSVSDFLLVAGPALLGLFTTMTVASSIHKSATSQTLPVFGYKRTV